MSSDHNKMNSFESCFGNTNESQCGTDLTQMAQSYVWHLMTSFQESSFHIFGTDSNARTFNIDISVSINLWGLFFRIMFVILFLYIWCSYSTTPSRVMGYFTDKLEMYFVRTSAKIMVRLVSEKELHKNVQDLVADGLNEWLVNPKTQQQIRSFVQETPVEDAAYGLGRKIPSLVYNFQAGFFSSIAELASKRADELRNSEAKEIKKSVISS